MGLDVCLQTLYMMRKVALLHAPFTGTTLFRGDLAKLQKANTECAIALTMFPAQAAPSHTYATKPYTGRGKSFRKSGYSHKRGGRDRDHNRSSPSVTITKPSKSGDGQTTMTVTVPQDSNKRKVQSNKVALRPKHARRARMGRGNMKQE